MTDEERAELLTLDLHKPIVRQVLAGYIAADLRRNYALPIDERSLELALERLVEKLPQFIDIADMLMSREGHA